MINHRKRPLLVFMTSCFLVTSSAEQGILQQQQPQQQKQDFPNSDKLPQMQISHQFVSFSHIPDPQQQQQKYVPILDDGTEDSTAIRNSTIHTIPNFTAILSPNATAAAAAAAANTAANTSTTYMKASLLARQTQTLIDPTSINNKQSDNPQKMSHNDKNEKIEDVCTLYLAASTIPGAGLGIFSGIPMEPNEVLGGAGGSDVVIPLVDVWWHLQASDDYRNAKLKSRSAPDDPKDFTSFFLASLDPTTDYVWAAGEMGMGMESAQAQDYVTAFSPGLDASINCHLALVNVDKDYPDYENLDLHRSMDPGAGAFSPYRHTRTFTTHAVPAGGELFKFYGDHWFVSRPQMFPPDKTPITDHYQQAELLIQAFDDTIEHKYQHELKTNIRADVWSLVTNLPWHDSSPIIQILRSKTATVKNDNNEINQEIHKEYDYLQVLSMFRDGGGIRGLYQPEAIRSLEDLQTNGRCVDGLRAGPSTLPQAGRGAFATRPYRKGRIVSGTPLLFTHREDFFRMYLGDWFNKDDAAPLVVPQNGETDHHDDVDPSEFFFGYQLVINYCMRHYSSSFYLCPYGHQVNLINHNQTQANVKYQWPQQDGNSSDFLDGYFKADWLTQSPAAMVGLPSPGLFLDLVATKDIQPGDELFLDYGDEWEQAWQEHVESFEYNRQLMEERREKEEKKQQEHKTDRKETTEEENEDREEDDDEWEQYYLDHDPNYISGREWNRFYPHFVLLTKSELEQHPYPNHLETRCLEEIVSWHHLSQYKSSTQKVSVLTPELAQEMWTFENIGVPCEVVERAKVRSDSNNNNNNDGEQHLYRVAIVVAALPPPTTPKHTMNHQKAPTNTKQEEGATSLVNCDGCDINSNVSLEMPHNVNVSETFAYILTAMKQESNPKKWQFSKGSSSNQGKVEYGTAEKDTNPQFQVFVSDWVPREAIHFFDKPYTSDLFIQGAFRHPIMIPDDIFPEAWMDYDEYSAETEEVEERKEKEHENQKEDADALDDPEEISTDEQHW